MKTFILRAICIGAAMGGAMLMAPAWAALEIQMVNGCPASVVDTSPEPNCPPEAACRKRGQTVHWRRDDRGRDFSLDFHGTESAIFDGWGKGACQSSANGGGQIVCRIADNAPVSEDSRGYKYDVEADNCPLDPRFIIR